MEPERVTTLSLMDSAGRSNRLWWCKRLPGLPIDVVKIDRSFVAGVAAASDEWALAQAIVRLIRTLKLETIAEGVETGAQVAHLRALGCDRLQGFYFAKPEPAETFRELLTAPSQAAAPSG
jgi:EAL domain-containing protein (putative c-di-GMP-specific phosphodiesterase class I)